MFSVALSLPFYRFTDLSNTGLPQSVVTDYLDPLGVEHVVRPADLVLEHGVDAGEDLVAHEAPHVELVDALHLRQLLQQLPLEPLHVDVRRNRLEPDSIENNLA